jgi:ribonuclease R
MKFSVADLLEQLKAPSSLPVADLSSRLDLGSDSDRAQLDLALAALERLGLVTRDGDGISRCPAEDLVEARLRCSSKGFCFALRDDGGEDIYIRDHQLNHAWNGDRVLVRVLRDGGRRRSPEGGVQCILERANTQVLAQVQRQEDGTVLAVPLDDRLQAPVHLDAGDADHADRQDEAVVEVAVDRFPVGQFPARGHVARSLSIKGGAQADRELLLARHRLEAEGYGGRAGLRQPTGTGREDLTGLVTLGFRGWEGADAPVLPAVSLETVDGGLRLWLHSPALAERLTLDGPMDRWIRRRGEAIALGDGWWTLLPPALQKAAAFVSDREQEAVSVALDLSDEGELQHYRFCLSRIKPAALLDRAALDAWLTRKPKARTTPAALKALKAHLPLLEQLQDLVARLRTQRQAGGSLDLPLPLPPLQGLDTLAGGLPDQRRQGWFRSTDPADPVGWLRELLRLAEQAFGRHAAALELPVLFQVQPGPDPADLNDVVKLAIGLEVPLELAADGNAPAPQALADALAASDRARVLLQVLRELCRPVQLSTLPAANALAAEPVAYAPWGAAALHYGALWNQAILVSLLTDGKDRPSVRHKTRLDLGSDSCHGQADWPLLTPGQLTPFQDALAAGLAARLNGRSRVADEMEADVIALAQARAAEPLVGQTLTGVISGVQSYGFFVELPPSQVEGLVHVSSLKDDWYEYRSRQHRLVGRKNRRTYKLGDSVEVEVLKLDVLRNQIDLAVVLPEGEEFVGGDDDMDPDPATGVLTPAEDGEDELD